MINIVANLVTGVAMSLPVVYINTISFFKHGRLVAKCDWNLFSNEPSTIFSDSQPANLVLYHDFKDFSEVELQGIDLDGKIITVVTPAAELVRQPIF